MSNKSLGKAKKQDNVIPEVKNENSNEVNENEKKDNEEVLYKKNNKDKDSDENSDTEENKEMEKLLLRSHA